MKLSQILLELNVINVKDVDRYARQKANNVEFESGSSWLSNRIRTFAMNSDRENVPLATIPPGSPSWVADRIKQNQTIHSFVPSSEFNHEIDHIIDWLNSLNSYSQRVTEIPKEQHLIDYAKEILKKLGKITYEQATSQADKWFALLNKINSNDDDDFENLRFVMNTPHGSWYQLMSQKALEREGSLMSHCVGAGSYRVAGPKPTAIIYSMRDANNEPHITVELGVDRTLKQVKGKQNRPPIGKYVPDVVSFLNHEHAAMPHYDSHDLEAMEIVYDRSSKHFSSFKDSGTPLGTYDGYDFKLHNKKYGGSIVYAWYGEEKIATIEVYIPDKRPPHISSIEIGKRAPANILDAIIQFLNDNDYEIYGPASILKLIKQFGLYYREGIEDPWSSDYWRGIKDPVKIGVYQTGEFSIAETQKSWTFFKDSDPIFNILLEPTRTAVGVSLFVVNESLFEKAEAAPAVLKLLNDLDPIPGEQLSKIDQLGIWRDSTHWIKFNPEELGFEALTNDLSVHSRPGKIAIFNADGDHICEITGSSSYKDSGYSVRLPAVFGESQISIMKKIRTVSPRIADLMNQYLPVTALKDREAKDKLDKMGIVKLGGKFKSLDSAAVKKVFEKDGYYGKESSGNAVKVFAEDGRAILKFSKTGYTVSIEPEVKNDRDLVRGAMLALSSWAKKYGYVQWPSGYTRRANGTSVKTNDGIYSYGLMVEPKSEASELVPITEVFPPRVLKSYSDDERWVEMAWTKLDDVRSNLSSPKPGNYSLLINNRVAVRVYCHEHMIREIVIVGSDKSSIANEQNIQPFVAKIEDLIRAESLKVKQRVFANCDMYYRNGLIVPLDKTSKLRDFKRGLIKYEDGLEWSKSPGTTRWNLRPEGEEYRNIIQVDLDGTNIHKIEYMSTAQSAPKRYRPYLNDLLDVIEEYTDTSS